MLVLAIFVVLTWVAVFSAPRQSELSVNFFDVGQGDSIFFTTAGGTQVLIDGGPDTAVLRKLGKQMPFYDRSIDLVVLTHPHADHVAGLVEVVKRYRVKNLVLTPGDYESATYSFFLQAVEKKKIKVIYARAGQKLHLDGATVLAILHPPLEQSGSKITDPNAASIVGRLSFGKVDFFLTGDATKEVEYRLIAANAAMPSEILKVGHHGSRGSTSKEFLEALSPEYAVVSVGAKNRYGHPHQETLELLENKQVKYWRTDQHGDVRIATDGAGIYTD